MAKLMRLLLAALIIAGVAAPAGGTAAQPGETRPVKIIKYQVEDFFVPQVQGMTDFLLQAQINRTLWGIVASLDHSAHYTRLTGDFEVSFYNGRLLGLHYRGTSYMERAAHPANFDFGIHIDLLTGKVYELTDLFRPGADFEGRVQEVCRTNKAERLKIAGLWDGWTAETFANSWNKNWAHGQFLLAADSVRLYTMPSSASGDISGYRVSYQALGDIVNPESELYKALAAALPAAIAVELEPLGFDDFIVRDLGVMPGDNAAWALAKLGEPKSVMPVPEGLCHDYGDFRLVTDAAEVISITTDSQWINTRRWVHAGQPLKLLQRRYGEWSGMSSAGGYDFYEYRFAWTPEVALQFAVKQGGDKISSITWRRGPAKNSR